MPIKRETGKDRWRRIPKDYFKAPDRLQGAKLRASAVAGVLALVWVASGVDWRRPGAWLATDGNSLRANHGTLARVHAAWDAKCEACHVPFEPIDGRPLLAPASTASSHSGDKLCMACHAGPAHHATMIASEVKGCAECHLDHRGRDASLVRLPDNECTNCHSSLEAHVAPVAGRPPGRVFGNVRRFDVDHPPFAPEAALVEGGKLRDRGRLKFNHARHMMPGIVAKAGDTPYTAESIPVAAERPRYQRDHKPTDPVQLDCSSCHQLDASGQKASANPAVASNPWPPRESGKYYLPITFEGQCRGCHVLTFDPQRKDLEVPHGVQPDRVVEFVSQVAAAKVLSDDPKLLDVFVPAARVPGKAPVPDTAKKRRDESVANALSFLFAKDSGGRGSNANNCLECHHYGEVGADGIPTKVEPTKVPDLWFTHAKFDHTAHRGVSCRDCHARSYALGEDGRTPFPDASIVSDDVLIPAIDNCRQCHAPAQGAGGWFASPTTSSVGGVSYDCNECHRYHNGDRPLEGPGAPAQDASEVRSLVEFLKGTNGPGRPGASPAR